MVKSLSSKLVLISLLLILLAMEITGVYLLSSLDHDYTQSYTTELRQRGELIGGFLRPYLLQSNSQRDLSPIIGGFGTPPGESTLVVDATGVLRGATGPGTYHLGQRLIGPTVFQSLEGYTGVTYIKGFHGGPEELAVTVPIRSDGQVVGAVEVLGSLAALDATLSHVRATLLSGTLLALLVAGLVAILLAQTISRPLKELTRRAKAMTAGDFDQRVVLRANDEVGQLAAAFNELTGRLKDTLGQMSEEKGRLGALLEYMTDGVIGIDAQGQVILVNGAALRFMSWQREHVLGKPLGQLWPKAQADALELDPTSTGVQRAELRRGRRILEVHLAPVRSGPQARGAVMVLQDVTEQRLADSRRKAFVANVSHELRTPLTTIKSYLEILLDGAAYEKDVGERFLQVTMQETDRMVRLVSDLLELSRLESGQVALALSEVPVDQLVRDVVGKLSVPAAKRGVSLALGQLCDAVVSVDLDRMQQVLLNLLSNALAYTPPGGHIDVSTAADQNQVLITVADTGVGIPAEDLPHVFERFYRVDKARSREVGGTGLGLSIAREIAMAHGGDVVIDSELGVGTKATIQLPLLQAAEAEVT